MLVVTALAALGYPLDSTEPFPDNRPRRAVLRLVVQRGEKMVVSLKNNAILLGLLGVADIVFIPTMTIGEPKAPIPAVVLTAMIGIASIVAAYGLMKGIRWARPLGITSRIFDAISTIPVFFVGVPTAELVGATIVMLLSILSAYLLIKFVPKAA